MRLLATQSHSQDSLAQGGAQPDAAQVLSQLTAQAASGQLPEGYHFVATLAGVAREAVAKPDLEFAAALACLKAASSASSGDMHQVGVGWVYDSLQAWV